MPSSKDYDGRRYPSILLVGDGGTEKTRFSAQAPRVCLFDFDAGLASTGDLPEFEVFRFKDVPQKWTKPVNKEKGFFPWGTAWTEFFNFLNDRIWPAVESGDFEGRFLVLDSLTTLTRQCMNYVLKAGGRTDGTAPTLPEYGSQLSLMESTLEQLAAWPVGLIVTAHIKRDDNLLMGTKEYLPAITGQLSARLGIYFDEVWFTEVKGSGAQRRIVIHTEGEGMYKQSKSRSKIPTETPLSWKEISKYLPVGAT